MKRNEIVKFYNSMSKIVYKAGSDFDFVKSIFYRAICIALMLIAFYHYDENPVVIIVFAIICFIFFLLIGNEDIIVYEDKIVFKHSSIASLFTKIQNATYFIDDIESAEMQPTGGPDMAEAVLIAMITRLIPNQQNNQRDNRFYLNLKNGEMVTVSSELYRSTLQEVVNAINSQVR